MRTSSFSSGLQQIGLDIEQKPLIVLRVRREIEETVSYGVRLHVWGERACFTRPEMKVERVSYDVMTPSAARGILEAVHWKPAIL